MTIEYGFISISRKGSSITYSLLDLEKPGLTEEEIVSFLNMLL